jgi:hypothetical protein
LYAQGEKFITMSPTNANVQAVKIITAMSVQ